MDPIDELFNHLISACGNIGKIRDERLYEPAGFATFDAYMTERWGVSEMEFDEWAESWKDEIAKLRN